MKAKYRKHPLLLLFFFSANFSYGETFSASFLDIEHTPNQLALGGSQVANAGFAGSSFNNPALLLSAKKPEFFLSHKDSFLENASNNFAFTVPFKNYALGSGLKYFRSPQIQRSQVGSDGVPTNNQGAFRPSVYLGHIAFAKKINRMSIGTSTKFWKEILDRRSYSGAAFDLGLFQEKLFAWFDFGVSVKNIGPQTNGHPLPRKWNTGISTPISWVRLLGNYEAGKTSESLNLGVETNQRMPFVFRAGYRLPLSSNLSDFNRLSFGCGIRLRTWWIDYSWGSQNDLSDEHNIALTIGLGLTAEEKKQALLKQEKEFSDRLIEKSRIHLSNSQKYINEKIWDQAIEELQLALTWDPGNVEAQKSLSQTLYEKNEAETKKLYEMGMRAAKNNEWIDATTFLQQAAQKSPQNNLYKEKAKWARSNISNFLSNDKSSQDTNLYRKGIQEYINGNFEMAFKTWSSIDISRNTFPELREYMAKAKANILENQIKSQNKKDLVEGLWEIDQLQTGASTDERLITLNSKAFQEYSQGNFELAIALWRRALIIDPQNSRIRKNIERVESELRLKGRTNE